MDVTLDWLRHLRLLQLADSALPVGTAAHSFGLETLAVEDELDVAGLATFLRDYLAETGRLESSFGRAAYQLGTGNGPALTFEAEWRQLNQRLSAFKPGRESRFASATLGRRFIQLVLGLEESPRLRTVLELAQNGLGEAHHCCAFGLAGGLLGLGEEATALAYLQQFVSGLVSACQRLLPLGQSQASQILWELKPAIIEAVEQSRQYRYDDPALTCFTPLLELAAMRHPTLPVRLFIS